MVLACSEKPFKRIEPPEAAQTIEDCRLTIVDLEERNQSEIFNLKSQIVGAGDPDFVWEETPSGQAGIHPASGVLKGGQGTGDETAVPTHGAGDEARTRDIQLGKLTLYQLRDRKSVV